MVDYSSCQHSVIFSPGKDPESLMIPVVTALSLARGTLADTNLPSPLSDWLGIFYLETIA